MNPSGNLGAKTKELIQKYLKAHKNREDPAPYKTELHHLYIRDQKEQLVQAGYRFLPQTWQEIRP